MTRRILALLIALTILAATATSALAYKPALGAWTPWGEQPAVNCGKNNTSGWFATYDHDTETWTQEMCIDEAV